MNSPQSAPGAAAASEHALMGLALDEARRAAADGDVPVGAVLVSGDGEVLAVAHNRREADGDPTAHAEILALRAAGLGRGRWRLDDCTLVVTLEPCTMCAGAIVLARVARVVLGAWDEKAGACGSTRDVVRDSRLNHRAEVTGGVRADESARLLTEFFAARRGRSDEAPRPRH
ncbi:tRNA adenosine(34) deaminase TadA [Occultella gossypii]|uniref:tRNA-specific adenosine deaminase n=1 Tax=Occultella gossypii TaxID=2800820 RepID=A0ABS7SCY5_9MICO|nr:tRNA adenosine(34) deaminase TadA [Occultella gossypii]MBZ2198127.1 tRNA adenosine(34) deaminase TadA [Occultella gossypii]